MRALAPAARIPAPLMVPRGHNRYSVIRIIALAGMSPVKILNLRSKILENRRFI